MQVFDNQGNLKQKSLVTSGVNSVTATPPLFSTGGSAPDISIALATALSDGYLSSVDWSTFNGKQNALTLTTIGSTGAATLIGATLNIPQYTDQYLGTVTSVGLSAGTGISIGGTNPVTSSGTISVTNTAPDQIVALTAGTGIGVSGTYPNFTITNSAPSPAGAITGSGTTNYLSKWTSSSALGNSLVFDNGTNVGIGTTSPSNKLHVVTGNVDGIRVESSNSGYLEVGKTSGARYRWANDFSTGNTLELLYGASGAAPSTNRITVFPNGNIHFGTHIDQGYRFFVTGSISNTTGAVFAISSGNVLIGTTTDAGYKLDVNGSFISRGTANVGGSSSVVTLRGTNAQAGYGITLNGDTWVTNSLDVNGRVSAGGSTHSSAIMSATSVTQGFLPPRMTGAQAEAIATPAAGLLVYANNGNGTTITSTGWWGYNGTTWVKLN